jgi:hypothetical protein
MSPPPDRPPGRPRTGAGRPTRPDRRAPADRTAKADRAAKADRTAKAEPAAKAGRRAMPGGAEVIRAQRQAARDLAQQEATRKGQVAPFADDGPAAGAAIVMSAWIGTAVFVTTCSSFWSAAGSTCGAGGWRPAAADPTTSPCGT